MRIRRKSIMHLRPRPYRARRRGDQRPVAPRPIRNTHPGRPAALRHRGFEFAEPSAVQGPSGSWAASWARAHFSGGLWRRALARGHELFPCGLALWTVQSGSCTREPVCPRKARRFESGSHRGTRGSRAAGAGLAAPVWVPPSRAERCAHARFQAGGHFVPQPARSPPLLRMFFPGTAGGASDRPPSAPPEGRVRRGAG